MRKPMLLSASFSLWLLAAPAQAGSADALFEQGRDKLKAGQAAEACPLFEKSHALDPALGTLLNLADCYEQTGHLVRAWTAFNEGVGWAARTKEAKREELAQGRASALKKRLAWLALSAAQPLPSLKVEVQDQTVVLGEMAQSLAVDPGKLVTVTARAPGYLSWKSGPVALTPGASSMVVIPALIAGPDLAPPPPPPIELGSASPEGLAPPVVVVQSAPQASSRTAPTVLMVSGSVVTAAGLGGLVWSYSTYGRLSGQRTSTGGSTVAVSREEFDTLRAVYPASWVVTGVGLSAVAAGAFWSASHSTDRAVSVTPAPGGATLSFFARF